MCPLGINVTVSSPLGLLKFQDFPSFQSPPPPPPQQKAREMSSTLNELQNFEQNRTCQKSVRIFSFTANWALTFYNCQLLRAITAKLGNSKSLQNITIFVAQFWLMNGRPQMYYFTKLILLIWPWIHMCNHRCTIVCCGLWLEHYELVG